MVEATIWFVQKIYKDSTELLINKKENTASQAKKFHILVPTVGKERKQEKGTAYLEQLMFGGNQY